MVGCQKNRAAPKLGSSHLLRFFGDDFNLLSVACKVVWEDVPTLVPGSCWWGMRDVSGSVLCLDPSDLLWKPRESAQKPFSFLPSLTLFSLSLQGRTGWIVGKDSGVLTPSLESSKKDFSGWISLLVHNSNGSSSGRWSCICEQSPCA